MKNMKTSLMCSRCFKNSSVNITYVGGSTVKLTCEDCGYTIRMPPKNVLDLDFPNLERRLLTKPARVAREMEKDCFHFVSSFPLRVITKPIRIARELEKGLM